MVARLTDIPPAVRRLGGRRHRRRGIARRSRCGAAGGAQRHLRRAHWQAPERACIWNRPIYTVGGRHLMSDALERTRNVFADLPEAGPVVDTEAAARA
jgi:hypothetical protein